MVRRLVVTLCLIAGLIGASFGTADAATVAPQKWAPKFCNAFHQWQSTLESTSKDASSAASATDLTTARDQIVSLIDKEVAATETAIRSVKKAGAPSSANGGKIQSKVLAGFQSVSSAFANAKAEAAGLSTTDATAFATDVSKVESDLASATDGFGTEFSKIITLDKDNEVQLALT